MNLVRIGIAKSCQYLAKILLFLQFLCKEEVMNHDPNLFNWNSLKTVLDMELASNECYYELHEKFRQLSWVVVLIRRSGISKIYNLFWKKYP